LNFLLDTNVLSEIRRPKPNSNVIRWLDEVDEDRCFISVATVGELRHGISLMGAGKRQNTLASWLENDLVDRFDGRILPIDQTIAFKWGDLLAVSKLNGRTMSVMDGWIAATAAVFDLTLVTRNTRDFEATEITLLNPWN